MADEITITSTFGRKKQVAPYEMSEASIVVSQTFRGDVSPEEIEQVAAEQFIHAKSRVFLELGLEYKQDEATMLVEEVFKPVEVVAAPARPVPPRTVPGGTAPARRAVAAPREDKADLFYDLMSNPQDWEQVVSDNPKSPDFRHKSMLQPGTKFRVSLWLNDAPEDFVNPF